MGDDQDDYNKGVRTKGTILENPLATGSERRGQDMAEALDRAGRIDLSDNRYDLTSTLGALGILVLVLGLAVLFLWLT